ncbi:MAG: DUF711 family protein [Anaerolineales bacterium]
MKIRSITGFVAPKSGLTAAQLVPLARLVDEARAAYAKAGYEVQTARLATTPFAQWIKPLTQSRAVESAIAVEAEIARHGFGYISLGPALPELPESFHFIPKMLAATKNVFFGGIIATHQGGIAMAALRACAEIIQRASTLEANGFANLRFAALANVPPGSPFFPAAYHSGAQPAFAIATQSADLAVQAFEGARTIAEGSRALTESIQQHGREIAKISQRMARKHGIAFGGIDFSLAPFPAESESLGTAFERMGVPAVGLRGSLAAAAVLTDAIDAANFPRAGFNGLLLPPLEDFTLAKRAAEGLLSISDLLMFSAVCGTGLDTVPLPGNSSVEQLETVLLDLAALALRLDKPLTARLMPIPGKQAGDETSFDFPFFANSRVMELKAEGLGGAFKESDTIGLKARTARLK